VDSLDFPDPLEGYTALRSNYSRPGPLDTGRLAAYYIVNRYIDNG